MNLRKHILIACIFLSACTQLYRGEDGKIYYAPLTKTLEDTVRTIQVQYIVFGCECANWLVLKSKPKLVTNQKEGEYIFLEPEDIAKALPDSLSWNLHVVECIGKFYNEEGYPKKYLKSEQSVDKARVFRYSSWKMIE
jgi:hypothetical protein